MNSRKDFRETMVCVRCEAATCVWEGGAIWEQKDGGGREEGRVPETQKEPARQPTADMGSSSRCWYLNQVLIDKLVKTKIG